MNVSLESAKVIIENAKKIGIYDTAIEARLSDRRAVKQGRNTSCECGSGKKYKRCCIGVLDDALHIIAFLKIKSER